MALVVETGFGTIGADSYESVEAIDAFWAARGGNADWDAADAQQKEVAARLASEFLDLNVFAGRPPFVDGQGLAFPCEDVPITLSSLNAVRRATAMLAPIALRGGVTAVTAPEPFITEKREKIADLEEVTKWAEPGGSGALTWNGFDVSWLDALTQAYAGGGVVLGRRSRA